MSLRYDNLRSRLEGEPGTRPSAPSLVPDPAERVTLVPGAAVPLDEARLLREIDPESVSPQVLMAHAHSKDEEKEYFFSMERYRLLSARVFESARNLHAQVFLVSSALAEEGKTLTTANLAYALSNAKNKRILLIELDLRRPSMRSLLRLTTGVHDEIFLNAKDWHNSLWSLRPNLHALLVDGPAEKPDSLLHSDATRHMIEQARKEYDIILIDSAPLLLAVDSHVLLPLVDRAVLVVRADSTLISCCQEALRVLGDKALGCVLNDVKRMKYENYYRAYYG